MLKSGIAALPMSTLGGANLHRWGCLPIIAGGFLFMAAGIGIAMWAGLRPALVE